MLAAKFTGLGLVVLLLSAVFELLTGEALSYDMFRNGVGFAYGAAVSIIIAFSKREAKLANDAVKALIFTICGIMIWMLIDLHVRPFEVVSAFAGVWYAVLVRRL